MRAAPGQVEDDPHMGLLAGRGAEHLVERGDLVAGHLAIGLRHLGAERDARDRERNPPARIAMPVIGGPAILVARGVPMRQVLRHPREQVAERPAKGEMAGSDENAVDDAHRTRIPRFAASVDCCGAPAPGSPPPAAGGEGSCTTGLIGLLRRPAGMPRPLQ